MGVKRILVVVAIGFSVVAVGAFVTWKRGQVPVGSEARVTLTSGLSSGYVWVDPGRGHQWCLAAGEAFPKATDTWDDGVMHSGRLATGVVRFDSDDRATFFGDVDGSFHPVKLVRAEGTKFGCRV